MNGKHTHTEDLLRLVSQALRDNRNAIDATVGLKTMKLLVRFSKTGTINEIVLTPESSTAWNTREKLTKKNGAEAPSV